MIGIDLDGTVLNYTHHTSQIRVNTAILTVTDIFCGAGGSSIGAAAAGAEVRVAIDYWPRALETHTANFPNAIHDCVDVFDCDPSRYPATDILLASPECTNHSLAKGKRRGSPATPAEERSRATMWGVPRFASIRRYKAVIVENVIEAVHWNDWDNWLHAMHLLGYEHQIVCLNSMFVGVPQSRDRMYVVFWRSRNPRPDLEFRFVAACANCGWVGEAVQSWKSTQRWGRYGAQYIYRCSFCNAEVVPFFSGAVSAIDWSLPAPLIRERSRSLKAATIERIRRGLNRHPTEYGLIVPYYRTGVARPTSAPAPTITTTDRHALIILPPTATPTVEDCTFRMVQPHEIAAMMAFPADYVVSGTKREQVRQLGNAVTPPVMQMLIERLIAALMIILVALVGFLLPGIAPMASSFTD